MQLLLLTFLYLWTVGNLHYTVSSWLWSWMSQQPLLYKNQWKVFNHIFFWNYNFKLNNVIDCNYWYLLRINKIMNYPKSVNQCSTNNTTLWVKEICAKPLILIDKLLPYFVHLIRSYFNHLQSSLRWALVYKLAI